MTEVIVSAVSGMAALLALSGALALLAACRPWEVSARSTYAVAMSITCLWCGAVAGHGGTQPAELALMLLMAAQALQSIVDKRRIRSIGDLNPFRV